MLDPIVKTIEVPCDQQRAFETFVHKVNSWWPRDRNSVSAMNGEVAKSIHIETRLGGEVYEIGHDDTRHVWGSVSDYQPFEQFSMNWHIGYPAEQASHVTVRFIKLESNRTQVELSHRNWEVFGDKAADMRAGYDSGWVGVFEEAYRSAAVAR